MSTYDELIKILSEKKMLSRYHLKKIGVFGSVLKSDNPNDIDILVENYEDYKDILQFKDELELNTGKKVDLVIEKFASPLILYRAKQDIQYVT